MVKGWFKGQLSRPSNAVPATGPAPLTPCLTQEYESSCPHLLLRRFYGSALDLPPVARATKPTARDSDNVPRAHVHVSRLPARSPRVQRGRGWARGHLQSRMAGRPGRAAGPGAPEHDDEPPRRPKSHAGPESARIRTGDSAWDAPSPARPRVP